MTTIVKAWYLSSSSSSSTTERSSQQQQSVSTTKSRSMALRLRPPETANNNHIRTKISAQIFDNLMHECEDFSEPVVECCCNNCCNARAYYSQQQQRNCVNKGSILSNGFDAIERLPQQTTDSFIKTQANYSNKLLNNNNNNQCCDQLVPHDSQTEFKLRSAALHLTQLVQKPNQVLTFDQFRRDSHRIKAILNVYMRLIDLGALELPSTILERDLMPSPMITTTTTMTTNDPVSTPDYTISMQQHYCDSNYEIYKNYEPHQNRYSNAMNPKYSIDSFGFSQPNINDYSSKQRSHGTRTGTTLNEFQKVSVARRWVLEYIERLDGYCDSISKLRLILKATNMIAVIEAYDVIVAELLKQRKEQNAPSYNSNLRQVQCYESSV